MNTDSKLMDMLTDYAAAHQHPVNIALHLIGIPIIMFGVFIPMTWIMIDFIGIEINLAQIALFAMFLFYLTLDKIFAGVFFVFAMAVAELATFVGSYSQYIATITAVTTFFGGYAIQFLGHTIEKSMPVVLKHPVQANLAAPFFTIVEIFKLLGFREILFTEVQKRIKQTEPGEAHDEA